jgi:2'-5' RNA ligase
MKKIDKNQLDLFGPQIWYEYLLVIALDKDANDAITLRKEKIRTRLGAQFSYLESTPHIPLLTLLHTEHELIIKRIVKILTSQRSFDIKLNGADFFEPTPESKILYIRVEENKSIQSLSEQIRLEIGRGSRPSSHITIAGGISSGNYKMITADMNDFHYEGEFLCTGITVLRRLKGDPDVNWDFKTELSFGGIVAEKRAARPKIPNQRRIAGL